MNHFIDIIFISHKRNRTLGLKLPVWFMVTLAATIALMTTATVVLFLRHTGDTIARMSLLRAEQENRSLIARLEACYGMLENTRSGFKDYIAQDNRERTYWQMAHIHPDVWSMGIGGISSVLSIANVSKNTSRLLGDVYESLAILKSRCQLRKKSLDEINGQIDKKYQLWSHIPSIGPIPGGKVGSPFGYRVDPITKAIRMHEGVDIGAPTGTPIYASADGIVVYNGWNMGYGLVVDIDHGYGFVSRYAHCNSILVKSGEIVKRGQVIATVGATGRVTCSHLHYEVHVSGVKVNPEYYIDLTDYIVD
jgi:murein DD-endopeptidase MepM/ murein hydrolase activator NlpD